MVELGLCNNIFMIGANYKPQLSEKPALKPCKHSSLNVQQLLTPKPLEAPLQDTEYCLTPHGQNL